MLVLLAFGRGADRSERLLSAVCVFVPASVRRRDMSVDHKSPCSQQVALCSDFSSSGIKRKVNVLEEDQYVEQLEQIVERDFFPDLRHLRAHSQLPVASAVTETPAFTGFTNQLSYQDTIRSEVVAAQQPNDQKSGPSLSLGKFLNKFTSEDNASFEVIMQDIHKREEEKYKWMFLDEKETDEKQKQQLALPDIEKQAISDASATAILTWPFKNKNSVMYYPEGAAYTDSEMQALSQRQNEVVLPNTRFADNPFNEMEQRVAIQEASLAHAKQANEGKIGPDGKVLSAPQVAGYSIVSMTPTPARLLTDASPLMTWGEIDGTPLRINSGTPFRVTAGTPSFRMPQTPAREELAHLLSDSIAKKHRDKRRHDAESARTRSQITGKSAQDQLCRMSPAAQRLATKRLGISRSSDSKLLASYTPDLLSQSQSPRTPLLRKSSGRTVTVTPSITDNLLNLPK